MLDFAKNAALQAGVTENIALKYGDVAQLANMFPAGSFDLILCHNLLEYVDDPAGVLLAAAGGLRDSSGILSLLIRKRAGEVLKAAIKDDDLAAAEHNLSAEHAHESLYGGIVRLFATDSLHASLRAAALAVIAERGVRVMSDYLPPEVSRTAKYQQILALERKLGRRPEFAAVARYTHLLARRAGPASQVQS
jgi:SAM-dependent methyltransferase